MHSGVISTLSEPLNNLINGPLLEAQTKVVEWDDISVQDFKLFCQFAYLGNYSAPEPVKLPRSVSKDAEPKAEAEEVEPYPEQDENFFSNWGVPKSSNRKSSQFAFPGKIPTLDSHHIAGPHL